VEWLARISWKIRGLQKISAHEDEGGFRVSGGCEEALRSELAAEMAAVLGKIQIAKEGVWRTPGQES
jgi:hypothetical protein